MSEAPSDQPKRSTPAPEASIRKRVSGSETNTREVWVLEYYDQVGKRRRKTFQSKSGAEHFAEATEVLNDGSVFLVDGELDYTVDRTAREYGGSVARRLPESLTVRSIIARLGKVWRENTRLSEAERTFLYEFATDTDRETFIDDRFLEAAVEGGKRLETYRYGGRSSDEGGRVGLRQFFGTYVVNVELFGEYNRYFGPFAERKDADDAFSKICAYSAY